MSLSIRILDTLRGCQLSGPELRYALQCSHEDMYAELVRLEAIGRLVCHGRQHPRLTTWGRA